MSPMAATARWPAILEGHPDRTGVLAGQRHHGRHAISATSFDALTTARALEAAGVGVRDCATKTDSNQERVQRNATTEGMKP